MRNKAGVFFMIIGAALIFGALFLFIHNQNEATKAETMSGNLMPQLVDLRHTPSPWVRQLSFLTPAPLK